jgi:hypothetical protein
MADVINTRKLILNQLELTDREVKNKQSRRNDLINHLRKADDDLTDALTFYKAWQEVLVNFDAGVAAPVGIIQTDPESIAIPSSSLGIPADPETTITLTTHVDGQETPEEEDKAQPIVVDKIPQHGADEIGPLGL